MTINYCPKCGSSIPEGSVYCPYCGYKLSLPQKVLSTFDYPQPTTTPTNIAYVRAVS
nr:zinc ribbon domain-containing protein [Candidatus Bathyarchaeota archaeon]